MYGVNVHDSMHFLNDPAAKLTQGRSSSMRIPWAIRGHSAPQMVGNHSEATTDLPQICPRFAARTHNGEGQDAR